MRYGSVCSGIEAATVAWEPLGWQAAWFAEIEPFPSAVLQHHYPDVPNHGDMTKFKEWNDADGIDLLVGGTPCQSFSVAGLRKGLADPRGNLMLTYLALAEHYSPRWVVWENVPGVLSSNGGKDFGTFLGALEELGYGWAYRVLDAQYAGVAQRRRRVFVVGYLGDWRRAAAVLFERHSLSGHPAPSREKGKGTAGYVASGFGQYSEDEVGGTIRRARLGEETMVMAHGHAVAFSAGNSKDSRSIAYSEEHTPPLRAGASGTNMTPTIMSSMQVRRLTPTECERLQGFPDGYTNIPWRGKPDSPDGPRYKALGNSMAVPVMHWIGKRIQMVEEMTK